MAFGEITGESIKSAVAQKLVTQFTRTGFTPKFYKEKILEGMSKPCFFIWTMDTTVEKQLNNNYTFTYQMNIRYHAEDEKSKLYEHLSAIALETVECLRNINVKTVDKVNGQRTETLKPITGKQISYQIVEGILQVYVTYTLTAYIPKTENLMETLIQEVETK